MIAIAILVGLVICILVFSGARKQGQVQEDVLENIKQKSNKIEEIGTFGFAEITNETSNLISTFMRFEMINRVFKFSFHEEYWIEFVLLNKTLEDLRFEISKVEIIISNKNIICDKTLLFEKVPEYIAPPYGNAYFDTSHGINFSLGKTAPNKFIFMSRFNLKDNTLADSDFITIEVKFNRLAPVKKAYELIETVSFKQYLKNIKFKSIQLIDGEIHWNENYS